LCLLNNMDIEKSKMNQIQYQSLVEQKILTSFNNTTFIKDLLIFIIKFISFSKKL
jgi:hypothetical protein